MQQSAPDGVAGWLLAAPAEDLRDAFRALADRAESSAAALADLRRSIASQQAAASIPQSQLLQSMGSLRTSVSCAPLLPVLLQMSVASLSIRGPASDELDEAVSLLLLEQYNAIVAGSRADPSTTSRERLPLPVLAPEDYGQATLTPSALKNRAAWAAIGMIPQYPTSSSRLTGDTIGPVVFVTLATLSHLVHSRQLKAQGAPSWPPGTGWSVLIMECAKLLLDDHITSLCSRDDELAVAYSSLLFVLTRQERDGDGLGDEARALLRHLREGHMSEWVELMMCFRSPRSAHIALAIKGTV